MYAEKDLERLANITLCALDNMQKYQYVWKLRKLYYNKNSISKVTIPSDPKIRVKLSKHLVLITSIQLECL